MDTLFQILTDFFKWFISFFTFLAHKMIEGVMAAVLAFVPDDQVSIVRGHFQTVGDYVNVANGWVPLDFAFSLFLCYIGIIIADRSLKMFVKLF